MEAGRLSPQKWLIPVVVALVALGACRSGEAPAEDRSPPSADATDADSALEELSPESEASHELLSLTPEEAYDAYLAEHGADLGDCGMAPPPEERSCPKPGSLKRDLKENVNVVLMLDASGSMQGRVGGETKMAVAKRVLTGFIGRLPRSARVALRVFGHVGSNSKADRARSCAASEAVLPMQRLDERKFGRAIRSFDASGWTPLARSLARARRDFRGMNAATNSNFVYVVSDGIESCGGDPVAQARRLNRSNIEVQVNIVGFDVDAQAATQLRRAAHAGAGDFFQAHNAAELDKVFRENHDWEAWTRYYNCKWAEAHRKYNTIWTDAHGAYNCVWNAIHEEYNGIWDDAHADYNEIWDDAHEEYNSVWNEVMGDDDYGGDLRDDVVELAQGRRDEMIEEARAIRDYVIETARERRDLIVEATRERRDDVLVEARDQRDRAIESAREQRDSALDE